MKKYYLTVYSDWSQTHYNMFLSQSDAELYQKDFKKSKIYEVFLDTRFYKLTYDYFTKEFDLEKVPSSPEPYYRGPKHMKDYCYIYIKVESGKNYETLISQAKESVLKYVSDHKDIFS